MNTEKRLRFLVSDDFLALVGKQVKEPDLRAQWLSQALLKWDGAIRGIPLSWYGKRHLNLELNARGQKVMVRSEYPARETFLSAVKQQIDEARRALALARVAAAPEDAKAGSKSPVKAAAKAPPTPAQKPSDKLKAQPAQAPAAKGAKQAKGGEVGRSQLHDGPAAPVAQSAALSAQQPAPKAHLFLVQPSQANGAAEPEELTQDQIDALHARLLEEQRDIVARMGSARNDNTDRVVDVADIASKSQDEEERQMFRVRLASQLQQVVDALKRIREGDYGWCEETGEPIGWHRLSANPSARYSVYAQARRERSDRFRVA